MAVHAGTGEHTSLCTRYHYVIKINYYSLTKFYEVTRQNHIAQAEKFVIEKSQFL